MSEQTGFGVIDPPWVAIQYRPRFGWRHRTLRLRPVRIGELGDFLALVTPFLAMAKNEKCGAQTSGWDKEVLGALSIVTEQQINRLRWLPEHVVVAAIHVMVEMNPEIFRLKEQQEDEQSQVADVWPGLIAELLACGHRIPDILGYSLAQMYAHVAAARRYGQPVRQERNVLSAASGMTEIT